MPRLAVASLVLVCMPSLACFVATADDVADDAATDDTTIGESGPGESGPGESSSGPDTSDTNDTNPTDETPESGSDTSSEPYCGNGVIEEGETCDAQDVGGMTCGSFNHQKGEITCNADCTLDVGGCYTCGDQALDGIEACDGGNLANTTCVALGFMAGELACSGDCLVFDTSACVPYPNCGNGQFDPGLEECEGGNLDGKTCLDFGFAGGSLACSEGCLFDTSGCAQCGNGVLEPGEECDIFDFGGNSCQDFGFTDGFLNCTEQCTVETYDCCIGLNCQQW